MIVPKTLLDAHAIYRARSVLKAIPLFERVLAEDVLPAHLPTLRTQAEKHLRGSRATLHPIFPARKVRRDARRWVKASLLRRGAQTD